MRDRRLASRWGSGVALVLACALACGGESESEPDSGIPETLAGWDLFEDAGARVPKEDVIPFDVTSPLFTDGALKHRYLFVPDGEQIAYHEGARWDFPVGSILAKTFAFPVDERDPMLGEQFVETRILAHDEDEGWQVFTYVWNEEQTEARRLRPGGTFPVSWIGPDGEVRGLDAYGVPGENTCRRCHGDGEGRGTLGPLTGMLNRDLDFGTGPENQIDHLDDLGLLDVEPLPAAQRVTFADPADETVSASERARGYLDANCAHCHSPEGETSEKELFLDYASTDPLLGDPRDWGVCKQATSAGNADCDQGLDVVPGDPDQSLLLCRMEITGPGLMPEVGRSILHDEGIELVRQWIADMDPNLLGGCGE